MAGTFTYWLVKITNQGQGSTAEIQRFPVGQKPLAANWGGAVYLGNTVQAADKAIARAAQVLHVPNPTHVPSLGTSISIGAIELGGFGAGAAGAAGLAGAAAVDAATGADTAAAGAAGGVASKLGSALTSGVAKDVTGAAALGGLAAMLTSIDFWQRIGEAILGVALLLLGLRAMTGGSGDPVQLIQRTTRRVAA